MTVKNETDRSLMAYLVKYPTKSTFLESFLAFSVAQH